MAKTQIVWTILPNGRVDDASHNSGKFQVSLVVSPRLTPESATEQTLGKFPEFLEWPRLIREADFGVECEGKRFNLEPITAPDLDLWRKLFNEETFVKGFEYKDMSKVNWRSYSVRNMLGYLKESYAALALQSASELPTLLPWKDAHPSLKSMLEAAGTRTKKDQIAEPGLDRFFTPEFEQFVDRQVFNAGGIASGDTISWEAARDGGPQWGEPALVRTMPPDWTRPEPGQPNSSLMAQFRTAEEYTLYQANRFYRREPRPADKPYLARPDFKDAKESPTEPEYDFHAIIASYANYPALLRRLGLIIDCVIHDEGWLKEQIGNSSSNLFEKRLQLLVKLPTPHDRASDITPFTAFSASERRFVTRSYSEQFKGGLVRMEYSDDSHQRSHGLFDIYQVDPDGAAQKTVNFTLSAQRLISKQLTQERDFSEVTYTTGDRQGVAALRSGGLGVSRHGRAMEVGAAAAAATAKNTAIANGSGSQITLFAEDVHRGYRVDVATVPNDVEPGDWRTLCAREGTYNLAQSGEALEFPPDEGYISGASTTSGGPDSANPDDHYLHESMFRWSGWSLCAPRPGMAIRARQAEDSQIQGEVPENVTDAAEKGNGILATFKALKGSLPRLRFGQHYRFRARIVDLAGNSLSFDDKSIDKLEQATEAVGYWRFEPIDPPIVVHRARVSEGESLERMVIRSNHDATAEEYLTTQPFLGATALPASQDFAYTADNERHFVPPKSSQLQCETHGLFDRYLSNWETIKTAYEIGAREDGTLYDSLPGSDVQLITPTALGDVATTSTIPPQLPSETEPVGERLAGGQYVIHGEAQIITPWLPDGAAAGTAIRAKSGHELPGVTAAKILGPSCVIARSPTEKLVILVRNKGEWPDVNGFRLILAERPAKYKSFPCSSEYDDDGLPLWDEDARTLTLFLPKGQICRLMYASYASDEFIKTFGIPQWTQEGSQRKFVQHGALTGTNWLITPFRDLTLVHATQAPVCEPVFTFANVLRFPAGSHDGMFGKTEIEVHGPSTGKIEIEADWLEWVDDPLKEGPEQVERKAKLAEVKLPENAPNKMGLSELVQSQIIENPKTGEKSGAKGNIHPFGDTKFRMIRYRMRATTRFREYLPPDVYDRPDAVTRLGPPATNPKRYQLAPADDPGAPVLPNDTGVNDHLDVQSSAPPNEPKVLYIVPTFRWQQSVLPDGRRDRIRHGNGLRVWLDRPWFSSGDGELLGVVLFGDGKRVTDIPDAYVPLVTQWGMDPFWDSTSPKSRTSVSDFPAAVHSETVSLLERAGLSGPRVDIVGHRVHWDSERKLWYCDIELNAGSNYMPFVRLALVRFQPNAIGSAKVSRVVLADFAQVLPRRRSIIKVDGNLVTARLHGPNPEKGPMGNGYDGIYQDFRAIPDVYDAGRNRVELVLQTRDPAIDSDLAWEDTTILASHVVGDEVDGSDTFRLVEPIAVNADVKVVEAALKKVTDATVTAVKTPVKKTVKGTLLGNSLEQHGVEKADVVIDIDFPGMFFELPFWEATSKLPIDNGRPRRLMLREFERFYSDDTVPRRHNSRLRQRRVVEERMVYADIIDL